MKKEREKKERDTKRLPSFSNAPWQGLCGPSKSHLAFSFASACEAFIILPECPPFFVCFSRLILRSFPQRPQHFLQIFLFLFFAHKGTRLRFPGLEDRSELLYRAVRRALTHDFWIKIPTRRTTRRRRRRFGWRSGQKQKYDMGSLPFSSILAYIGIPLLLSLPIAGKL